MIPKEDADSMKPLMAGEMLSDMMDPIDDAKSTKENKLIIFELW